MCKEPPSPVLRYGVALLAGLLALTLTLMLWPVFDPPVFALFFAAVMVSAWYGGLGPGLLATTLAVLGIDLMLLSAHKTLTLPLHSLLRLALFILVSLLISSLTAARKRAEAALRQARDELEMRVHERTEELAHANMELWRLQREMGRIEPLAALGRITGTIAHELGTPLNSVLGYSQLLAQDDLSENARECVQIIETQVQRMVDIIHHYLSQTRSSQQHFNHIRLATLLRETVLLLDPIFHQHHVQFTLQLTEELPPLRGDGASLQRVFINLLTNAMDAMEQGGTVTITARTTVPADSTYPGVCIEINDTGSGIAPELVPRIFDLFVSTKASGKGTGLGLAVCQEIVRAHGGVIEVRSQVGQGTCVRVILPAERCAGHAAPVKEHS